MIFFRKLTVMNLTFRFIFQDEFLFSNNELLKSQLSVFSFISRQNYHLSLRCIRPGELSIYLQVVLDLFRPGDLYIYLQVVLDLGIIIYLQFVLDLGNYLSISRLYQTWGIIYLSLGRIRPGELSIYLYVVLDLGNYLSISSCIRSGELSISRLYYTWGIIYLSLGCIGFIQTW